MLNLWNVSIQRIVLLGRLRREPTVDEVKLDKSIQIFFLSASFAEGYADVSTCHLPFQCHQFVSLFHNILFILLNMNAFQRLTYTHTTNRIDR